MKSVKRRDGDMKRQMGKKTAYKKRSRERPEDSASASEFYSSGLGDSHRKNAIRNIQRKITARALGLLAVEPPARLLDGACGFGFSGELAKEVGFDVSGFVIDGAMVEQAKKIGINAVVGDLVRIPFADSSFYCAISISGLQWLGAEKSAKEAAAEYGICAREFFRVLRPNGRAVIQFYPLDEKEAMLAGRQFANAGFAARLQIDSSDNPKKRKVFIVAKKGLGKAVSLNYSGRTLRLSNRGGMPAPQRQRGMPVHCRRRHLGNLQGVSPARQREVAEGGPQAGVVHL